MRRCVLDAGEVCRWDRAMGMDHRRPEGVKTATTELLGVLLPVQCVGCGTWDTVLCPQCAALARHVEDNWHVLELGPRVAAGVWTLGEYDGPLRRIVLAAKHAERVEITSFLERAGRSLGEGIADSGLLGACASLSSAGISRRAEIWVVPAPSGWTRRFRGQMVAPMVATGVAQTVAQRTGAQVRVIGCARLRAGARSQSGRTGDERRSGRSGSMVAAVPVPPGVAVVLVDDVITTGATVRELARVCGPGVVAVAAVCRVGHPST